MYVYCIYRIYILYRSVHPLVIHSYTTKWYPKYSGPVSPSIQQLWECKALVPIGQTVNSRFYCDVLRQLHENMRRRCLELLREQTSLLHHENALSHTSVLTQQILAKYKWLSSPTHRTPLIWHPVTPSYFQNKTEAERMQV
jgi:hypothetical protein